MKKLLIVLVLLITAGCGPWVRTESTFTSDTQNFSATLPEGWMRRNTDKIFMITRDGVLLQRIVVTRLGLATGSQFEYTRKRLTSGMLPQEAAEIVLDDFQSNMDNLDVTVEENAPSTVAGKSGFKARFSFRTKEGLTYRCAYYGVISGEWFYGIYYLAPKRYYFDKDLGTFERMIASFKLKS
jgi:hypothetical protein